jgi:GrpB-like predicted nucleotidyltransferase (UPF0157 family)
VEIIRFDREVSTPERAPSSGAWVGPLARTDETTVGIVHLGEGGCLRFSPGTRSRLLAVTAGACWASDDSGERIPLAAGRGGLWPAGESFEVGSEAGMTAVLLEGEWELQAFEVSRDIVVVDYDPSWASWFEQLCSRLRTVLGDDAKIDHVGSTSVPGLAAKPIIDLDVVVPSDEAVRPVVEQLESIGYRWRGDLGVLGREAFAPPADAGLPLHHLYVVVEDNRAHQDHWLLRDLLRADPTSRARYAALKRANAESANRDIDVYVESKADFVAELLARARAERGMPPVEYWRPETRN